MADSRIDIRDVIDYVDIDDAIDGLIKLREKYGSKSYIDVELEPVPYEDREEIAINLIVRNV